MTFDGEKLRELREHAGLSQAQLGALLGLDESTISRWEDESREPKINDVVRLAAVLGIHTLDTFVKHQPRERNPQLGEVYLALKWGHEMGMFEANMEVPFGVAAMVLKDHMHHLRISWKGYKVDGDALRDARRRAGFTRLELAKYLGVTTTAIAWWEEGRYTPDIKTLARICHRLQVGLSDITRLNGDNHERRTICQVAHR